MEHNTAKPTLTICTVSYKSTYFIERHWEMMSRLCGDDAPIRWVVVDNTPIKDRQAIKIEDERLVVIPGPDESQFHGRCRTGLHHGAGLNKAVKHVSSRFLLVIDPDFFIVHKDWVSVIMSYMINERLSFLGVPWNPRWYVKPRYFPACVHCLFIDLDRIDISDIDFMPCGFSVEEAMVGLKKKVSTRIKNIFRPVAKVFEWMVLNRRLIGSERDTGYQIFQRFARDTNHRFESIEPVFHPTKDFLGPAYAIGWPVKLLEKLLPDRYCYIPKHKNYFTERGFCERGYPDLTNMDWEEFVWQDKPFGFHVRSYPKAKADLEKQKGSLLEILEGFVR